MRGSQVDSQLGVVPDTPFIGSGIGLVDKVIPIRGFNITHGRFIRLVDLGRHNVVVVLDGVDNETFVIPVTYKGDMVVRQWTIYLTPYILRGLVHPLMVVRVQTTNGTVSFVVWVVITGVYVMSSRGQNVMFQLRDTTTTPTFITSTRVFGLPKFFPTIFTTRVYREQLTTGDRVFGPLVRFAGYTKTSVTISVQVTTRLATGLGVFVHTREVVFCGTTPINICRLFALDFVTSAILPVVFVHGTTTEPARGKGARFFGHVRGVATRTLGVQGF